MEVSGVGVLLRSVLLQKKEEQDTLILNTCHIMSFIKFPSCAKKKDEWKAAVEKGAPFLQGFQNIGVSGVGVLLGWVLLQKQEEKDTRRTLKILDTPLGI